LNRGFYRNLTDIFKLICEYSGFDQCFRVHSLTCRSWLWGCLVTTQLLAVNGLLRSDVEVAPSVFHCWSSCHWLVLQFTAHIFLVKC